MLTLGLLASHRGSNVQAVVDACRTGRLDARPGVVISNNANSGVLQFATASDAETGVTVHLVDEEYDHGNIVAQCRVPVQQGDTLDSLSARVLEREHEFLVETLQAIARGDIDLPALQTPGSH